MFNDFLTLEALKIWMVAVSVTVLITQFTKEIVDWIFGILHLKIPTKYVVYCWSLTVIFLPQVNQIQFSFEVIATNILNGIIITLAAMKSYEIIAEKAIQKIEEIKYRKPPEIKPEVTE
jgi:hypothetical protein